MKHEAKALNLSYKFDATHKGAPYTVDGIHYMNGGDFAEVAFKAVNGFDPTKDANGRYDLTDDVPELNASVKSAKATLVNKILGHDFDSSFAKYLQTVHSNSWVWVAIIDEVVNWWTMDKKEFSDFTKAFGYWAKDRNVIRFKTTTSKMIAWFENRV